MRIFSNAFSRFFAPKRIYLDYAAATPVREEVQKAMSLCDREVFANASAIHKEGQKAKEVLETARQSLATSLRVRQDDVVFTSGGTESNNLALKGAIEAMRKGGVRTEEIELISLATEHPSVLNTLKELESVGVKVFHAPIDHDGLVILSEFKKLLSPRTRLVSIAYANSEIGVVQDLSGIGRAIKAFEKENGLMVLFHADASQAPLWLPCALDALYVDMMTLDAGKCRGPKGVGVLVARPRAKIASVSFGGSQEKGLRPGTEPVSSIVGASLAVTLAQEEYKKLGGRTQKMRDRWIRELQNIDSVVLNGSPTNRLPNNINISIPGLDTEFAVVTLDAAGIATSTKSACSGAGGGYSHVVFSMTGDLSRASSTIRFTLGPDTTYGELRATTLALKKHIARMKEVNFDLA